MRLLPAIEIPRPFGREAIHERYDASPRSRPKPGVVALDHRLHGVLCGLDDLFHHRRADQARPGPHRHSVRAAGRHAHPYRLADPPDARHLDRPVRRPHRLYRRDAVGRGCHLAPYLRLQLSHVPAGGPGRGHRRRLVRSRHRLRLALVPDRAAGHGARHLRRRQRRCGRHQVPRPLHHGRLRLADGRQHLGRGHRRHGRRLLAHHQGRPAARGAAQSRPQAGAAVGHVGAAEERPGLALLALLLLRVRRLRGALAVAAALPDRRLRPRYHNRRHDRRRLLDPREPVPRLRRPPLRHLRCAPRHVLDLRRVGRGLVPPLLSAHRVHRAGHPRADVVPA